MRWRIDTMRLSLSLSLSLVALIGLVSGQSRNGVNSPTCAALHSCSNTNSSADDLRSCSCHPTCVYLDTCCADYQPNFQMSSQQLNLAERLQSRSARFTCEMLLVDWVVVVNSCEPNSHPSIKNLCLQDSPNELKVTSNVTRLTYKNVYCGMCNSEKFDDLKSWSWNLDCIRGTTIDGTIEEGRSLIENAGGCSLNATLPTIPPDDVEVYHRQGVYLDTKNLCNSPPVRTCNLTSEASIIRNCTNGPNNFVEFDGIVYKNEYCVQCNNGADVSLSEIYCESCEFDNCLHKGPQYHHNQLLASFGILVQPYSTDETITCKTEQNTECMGSLSRLTSCGYGQYLNFQTTTCENICPALSHLQNGECMFTGAKTLCIGKYADYDEFETIQLLPNISVLLEGTTFVINQADFMKCYRCDSLHAYTDSSAGDLFIGIPDNFIYRDSNSTRYICADVHHHHEEESIITIVCLTISITGLILYFIAYAMFSRFRNVPGQLVMGNMICLLLSYVFFLVRLAVQDEPNGCIVIAILIHYFFLAAFVFVIIYASFIIYSLELVDFDASINKWTPVKLWMIGVTAPFLVLAPALTLNFTNLSEEFNPEYGGSECFIMNEKAKVLYFVAPIGLCLLISILLYSTIIFKLIQLARETRKVRSHHREKITVAIKLLVVLGFNWIFAVVAAIKQEHVTTFIFIATCSLQGFFGFIVFICNKKTLKDLKKFNKTKPILESSMSTTKMNTLTQNAKKTNKHHEQAKNLLQKQETYSTSE